MKSNTLSRNFALTSLLIASICLNNTVAADEWEFHAATSLNTKSMDVDGWRAIDTDGLVLKQDSFVGGMFDMKKTSWPLAIAIDLFVTGDNRKNEGFEETAISSEVHIGVRKYWGTAEDQWRPYFGGGVALLGTELQSEFDNFTVSESDADTGLWVGGGINLHFNAHWYVGLDVRYSTGSLEVFEQKRDLDGVMSGLSVGFVW